MKEKYEGIDGLKEYSIIGIVLMNVIANGEYRIEKFVFNGLFRPLRTTFSFLLWSAALACVVAITRKLLTRRLA